MADFTDSCVRPEMDETKIRLLISPDKPTDVASPYAVSSSAPESAKNDDEEFKKIDQSHGEVFETSWKLISSGNGSCENASIEQEVSRYQTCNRVTALPSDKNDADCTRSKRCGMHEDLLFNIMLWLPVLSLLRFRSVCRLWCSLIDSYTFITQHYNHNSSKSCLLAHHVLSPKYHADYNSKFCLLGGNKYEVYSNLNYDIPWYSVNEITILNSCNGIVSLLNEESGDVALWNPATKQLRPLPKSSVYPDKIILIFNEPISLPEYMTDHFGFGFDVKSNDYKCVKILYCIQAEHANMVEVYSLKTDSWKTIHKDDGILPFCGIVSAAATCNKGACFWIGYAHHDSSSPILISFDLNREVFETMPLPGKDGPNRGPYRYNALDLLNDKLCYIKTVNLGPDDGCRLYFEIWMLDDNGVKESWKSMHNGFIGTCSEMVFLRVLGFSKNGEFLLLGYRSKFAEELFSTNFDPGEVEYFELQTPKPLSSKFICYNKLQNPNPIVSEFVWYDESLVSFKREDGGARK